MGVQPGLSRGRKLDSEGCITYCLNMNPTAALDRLLARATDLATAQPGYCYRRATLLEALKAGLPEGVTLLNSGSERLVRDGANLLTLGKDGQPVKITALTPALYDSVLVSYAARVAQPGHGTGSR